MTTPTVSQIRKIQVVLFSFLLALAMVSLVQSKPIWAQNSAQKSSAQNVDGAAATSTHDTVSDQSLKRPLTVYTAMTATTAQLPLLGAIKKGWPQGTEAQTGEPVKVEYWKNLEDLRALVLAGKGDVWVGHLETLSRAASRGAPVSLVAVTVWRKFYFVTAPLPFGADGSEGYPSDVGSLLKKAAEKKLVVTTSPQNSPQGNLLNELKKVHGDFPTDYLPPQQLILELLRGQRYIGLLPEPMASSAVLKNPKLKIIGSLEEEYSKSLGGPDLLPQAGVAINLELAASNPEVVNSLISLMTQTVKDLEGQPVSAYIDLLPREVKEAVGLEVLEASLSLEPLIIRPAYEVRDEIKNFLLLAAPDLFETNRELPKDFLWSPELSRKALDKS